MNKQLQKTNNKKLARPLKVLVPLIKADIAEMKKAADDATMPYQVKIGEELSEAKSQMSWGQWGPWLQRNFHLSQSTANSWVRAASKFSARGEFTGTLAEAYGDNREPSHRPPWNRPVANLVDRARKQTQMWRDKRVSEEKERELERHLAFRLIDIGYKILSVELHPDKRGGSDEAMARLNAVRARLKQAA